MQREFYAKAEAILSVTGSEKTQSVRVHFCDASNQLFAVDFPELVLGNLVTLLLATASKLSALRELEAQETGKSDPNPH